MARTNESTWDRVLRVILGVIMLYVGWLVLGEGLTATVLKIFGFIPLITGFLGWCPFYTLLGWSTRRIGRPD